MKRFYCHKVITAGRIASIEQLTPCHRAPLGGIEITLEDKSQFIEHGERFERAKLGQFFVIYEDGYKSINPTLDGYTELAQDQVSFGVALEALKSGMAITRVGWNGKGMFVYMVPANAYPAQTGVAKAFFGEGALVPYRAYMALKGADGQVSTWAPSGSDALADDWLILEASKNLQQLPGEPIGQPQYIFKPRDPSLSDQQQGIYNKFIVRRVDGSDGPGRKHNGCAYFVLDLTHDQHAKAAMRAYGAACVTTHPVLAQEIADQFGPFRLDDYEQYRQQLVGISTAALGYWKEGESIHRDYVTEALRDVAQLYEKYDRLHTAMREAMNELGVPQPGYPAPVKNAYDILHRAFYRGIESALGPDDYRPAPLPAAPADSGGPAGLIRYRGRPNLPIWSSYGRPLYNYKNRGML